MNIIVTNSDNTIQFAILDSEGTPIDPTGVDVVNIEIAIYQRKEVVLQKFSKTDGTVIVDDAAGGLVSLSLDKLNLKGISTKRVYGELVLILTNASFANNQQRIVLTDIIIGDVKPSVLSGS